MRDEPQNLLGTRFEKVLIPIEAQLRLELDKVRAESEHNLSVGEQLDMPRAEMKELGETMRERGRQLNLAFDIMDPAGPS